ncbi:probable ergosterol biosynthetic protein 28 [Acanthaster planci]|uniref:Probable ergosterol biosynthetic protein 28 n=1 Tax=Acanthaster planci TaxID=133434 RepID=A0A8B7ZDR4_ACAPL|nr:probable ergosterol biosynthetic protein 28 [Acanthaster planci]
MLEAIVRVWVGIVGLTALFTSMQCFIDSSFLAERIYTLEKDAVNPAFGRLFGTWTCLAGVVRILWALFTRSKPLYLATLFSFVLALVYFLAEFLIFKTAALTVGVISPLIVAGGSTILMIVAFPGIFHSRDPSEGLQLKKH